MLLENKVALITGAASETGIGSATARLFAAEGARTVTLDLPGQDPAAFAERLGAAHRGIVCDVADRESCAAAVDAALAAFGRIDILVNNAGIVRGTRVMDITLQEYDMVMDVNLRGNFHMAQAVIPAMRAAGSGAIVCISSIAGQVGGGLFGSSHYAASKGGIFSLAKALARELAPEGIRVNAVAPGVIDNDFTHGDMTAEIKADIATRVPMRRLGRSGDIANACLFLASDLSSYVTGAVIDVNGGLHIH